MEEAQKEVEYRDIPGFPGYRVGNDSSVWSCWRLGPNSIMSDRWKLLKKQTIFSRNHKYTRIHLTVSGKTMAMEVGRVMLLAFCGSPPEGMECCHGDGDSANNRLENLRWGTHKENMEDKCKHGKQLRGEKSWSAKITEDDVRIIYRLRSEGFTVQSIADIFRLANSHVSRLLRGLKWKHLK
jgi:hypothetical protein